MQAPGSVCVWEGPSGCSRQLPRTRTWQREHQEVAGVRKAGDARAVRRREGRRVHYRLCQLRPPQRRAVTLTVDTGK